MAEATQHTWTEHTFRCQSCFRLCRASQEAIAQSREISGYESDVSDAEIVEGFDFCLACVDAAHLDGEIVPMRVKLIAVDGEKETVVAEDCDLRELAPDDPDTVYLIAKELGRKEQTLVGGGAAQLFRVIRISG